VFPKAVTHVGPANAIYPRLLMAILITGAEGQLGQELSRQLGSEARGIDRADCDLTNRQELEATLNRFRPQIIINAAAYTLVDRAEDEPELCRAVNATAVGWMAEWCREAGGDLVQISTDYVFGGDAFRRRPYREDDPPAPLSVYGHSKWEGEQRAAQAPQFLIVRTCGLYGKLGPRSPGNFVQTILRRARAGQPLRVVDDQFCTPSYVVDVARAIVFLIRRKEQGIIHVVNRGETTWYRFAREICRLAGVSPHLEPIRTDQYPAKARRPAYSVLDTSRYHSLPGVPPMPTWQQAVAEYLSQQSSAET